MLNDRDPNQEAPKSEEPESEYHFSDEDVSYELEEEEGATQQPAAPPPPQSLKDKLLSRLSTSKRMLITLGVFLVLIFVVYKMVTPSGTQTPSTEIKPVVATAAPPVGPAAATGMVAPPVPPPVAIAQPQLQPSATAQQAPAVSQQPGMEARPEVPTLTRGQQMPAAAQMQPQQMQPQQMQPQQMQPQQIQPQQMQPQQMQPQMQAVAPVAAVPSPQMQMPPQQPVVTMPPVIPVQAQVAPIATQPSEMIIPSGIPSAIPPETTLSPEAERLIGNLQVEYAQRLNDFANQNKNMSEEIQLLNSRVASLEAELNQLTQQLTEKARQAPAKPQVPPAARVPTTDSSLRTSYSVQAIIPGRAWLRADNGETVTVTEGDSVRDLGRITKIDPYDGVVEVNTGTKVVSISYGTGT